MHGMHCGEIREIRGQQVEGHHQISSCQNIWKQQINIVRVRSWPFLCLALQVVIYLTSLRVILLISGSGSSSAN